MTDDRKARLASLAARAGRNKTKDDAKEKSKEEGDVDRSVNFRNYAPRDDGLKRQKLEEDDDAPSKPTVSALHEALQVAEKEEGPQKIEPAAATKSLNWDLKRDIQPKLDKLERQTQRAIVDLLKARLQREAAEAAAETEEEDLD